MNQETIKPQYGPTNPTPAETAAMPVRRVGSVIELKPEKEKYYRELHANAWQTIVDRLKKSNIHNYTIYITEIENKKYLFSHFDYVGKDFESDMQAVGNDPETQRWLKETDPCQAPLPTRKPEAYWSEMEMVFLME